MQPLLHSKPSTMSPTAQTILVTGSTGCICSHTVVQLLEAPSVTISTSMVLPLAVDEPAGVCTL